jgi:hypothetical protein
MESLPPACCHLNLCTNITHSSVLASSLSPFGPRAGESLPVKMTKGGEPKMGSNVVRGEVEATVRYTGVNTFFGKTADLLNVQKGMDHLQKNLLTIVAVLTVISIVLCLICFIYIWVTCAPSLNSSAVRVMLSSASMLGIYFVASCGWCVVHTATVRVRYAHACISGFVICMQLVVMNRCCARRIYRICSVIGELHVRSVHAHSPH